MFDSILMESKISRMYYSPLKGIVIFSVFITTTLILWGYLKLPNFSEKFKLLYPKAASLAVFSDLNLYWFILNAFLLSVHFDRTSRWFLLMLMGFVMALTLSNVRNSLEQKSTIV